VKYKDVPREKVKLPKRQKAGDYREPDYPYKFVKETALRLGHLVQNWILTAFPFASPPPSIGSPFMSKGVVLHRGCEGLAIG
jgi:hypothetical protein